MSPWNFGILGASGSGIAETFWSLGFTSSGGVTEDRVIEDSSDGSVYYATSLAVSGYSKGAAYKFDANGNKVWSYYLSTLSDVDQTYNLFTDVVVTADHAWFVGESQSTGSLRGHLLVVDKATGAEMMNQQWGTSDSTVSRIKKIIKDGSDNVYVAGSVVISTALRALVTKYSSSGQLLWTARIAPGVAVENIAIALDGSGNLAVFTGGSNPPGGLVGATLLNPTTGARIWHKLIYTYAGGASDSAQFFGAADYDASTNKFYVAINGSSPNQTEIAVLTSTGAYDSRIVLEDPTGNASFLAIRDLKTRAGQMFVAAERASSTPTTSFENHFYQINLNPVDFAGSFIYTNGGQINTPTISLASDDMAIYVTQYDNSSRNQISKFSYADFPYIYTYASFSRNTLTYSFSAGNLAIGSFGNTFSVFSGGGGEVTTGVSLTLPSTEAMYVKALSSDPSGYHQF